MCIKREGYDNAISISKGRQLFEQRDQKLVGGVPSIVALLSGPDTVWGVMEYQNLGRSGLLVSRLSFGAWITFGQQVGEREAEACMQTAYDAGCNFFDNAEVYAFGEAERVMGRIFKKVNWPRDRFIVSSKVMFGAVEYPAPTQRGLSRKHIFEACDGALSRLGVDYLDLYFCHRPDPQTPVVETVLAMNDLIRMGKVLYWGTSEWSTEQLLEAFRVAEQYRVAGPTMEQPQYNLFSRDKVEREFAPLYADFGLGTTTWSPLASGLLTGKYNKGATGDTRIHLKGYQWLKDQFESEEMQKRLPQVDQLGDLAGAVGIPLARFALAWCLKNPNVSTVITGASKVSQVEENMRAIEDLPKLTDDVLQKVEMILAS